MKTCKISCRKVKISISPRGGNFQFSARGERYVYLKLNSPRVEMKHVLVQRCRKIEMNKVTFNNTYKCYKVSKFHWKNDLAKSLFCHETDWVLLSKVLTSEAYLELCRTSLMAYLCENSYRFSVLNYFRK